MVKKKLPKHLQEPLDRAMKTDKGRRLVADLIGAAKYRNKAGKMVKRRKK